MSLGQKKEDLEKLTYDCNNLEKIQLILHLSDSLDREKLEQKNEVTLDILESAENRYKRLEYYTKESEEIIKEANVEVISP